MSHVSRAWRHGTGVAVWLAACLLGPGALAAEPEPSAGVRAVTLNDEGARYYAARDYRRAVERFIQAYAVDNDPNLLFNIASCYEGLGDMEAAVEKYREFTSAEGADPSGRPHAEQVIRQWEQSSAEGANTAPAGLTSSTPPPAPSARDAVPRDEPRATDDDSSGWVPWVALGGGATLMAIGGTLYVLGVRDHSEVTDAEGYDDPTEVSPMTRAEADALVDSGSLKKQIGVGALAVGGVLITSYVVWSLFDEPDRAEVTPAVAPSASGASLTLSGRF